MERFLEAWLVQLKAPAIVFVRAALDALRLGPTMLSQTFPGMPGGSSQIRGEMLGDLDAHVPALFDRISAQHRTGLIVTKRLSKPMRPLFHSCESQERRLSMTPLATSVILFSCIARHQMGYVAGSTVRNQRVRKTASRIFTETVSQFSTNGIQRQRTEYNALLCD